MKSLKINLLSLIIASLFMTCTAVMAQDDIIWIGDDYSGEIGNVVEIEVMMSNPRTSVSDFSLQVTFDRAWFSYDSFAKGTLTNTWADFTVELLEPGTISIAGNDPFSPIPSGSSGSLVKLSLEVICPDCEEDDTTILGVGRFSGDIDRFEAQDGLFTYGLPACLNHGDVNLDGEVTSTDAQLAFFIVLGTYSPEYEEWCAADCLGTGEVTAADAQAIFFVVLGLGDCADSL